MIYDINKIKSIRLEILKYKNLELIPDQNSKILKFANADKLELYIMEKKLLIETTSILNLKPSPALLNAKYRSMINTSKSLDDKDVDYSDFYNNNSIYTLADLFLCNTINHSCNKCPVKSLVDNQMRYRSDKEDQYVLNHEAHREEDLPKVYTCQGVFEYMVNSRK